MYVRGESVPNEKELVRRAKVGEQEAFSALVSAYEGKIYNLALRYLGNREDAMDASQETFLRMFRFLSGFQEDSSFSTWLYRICVNVCKDQLARRARRNEQPLEYGDGEEDSSPMEIPDERYDPVRLAEGREQRRILTEAIDRLPLPQREMILLRDIRGLSYEEIGQVLSLESGTVKSRLFRARESLRKKLLQNGNIFGLPVSKEQKGGSTDEIL